MNEKVFMSRNEWKPEPELQRSFSPRKVVKRHPVPLFWRLFLPVTVTIFIIFSNKLVITQEYITRFGMPITGVVEGKKIEFSSFSHSRSRNRSPRYMLVISYQIQNGQKITDKYSTSRWEYNKIAEGNSIDLMLHPSNPREARLLSSKGQGVVFFFLEFIILILAVYGIILLRKKFDKQRKIITYGQVVPGIIKQYKSDETPSKVIVDYEIAGAKYNNRTHSLMYPRNYTQGEYVTLLVNPKKPEEFIVYLSGAYKVC